MDDLILNISEEAPSARPKAGKKGGRWTDRVKAKQIAKRKVRTSDPSALEAGPDDSSHSPHPAKKRRTEGTSTSTNPVDAATIASKPTYTPKPSTQVISSLFSYNPAVTAPARARAPATAGLPSNAPIDSSSFSGLGLDPLLTDHLSTKLSISAPTSIQRASLPILLRPYDASFSSSPSTHRERDVFIQSQTGSGKTLAFLLPIIQDLLPLSSLSWIDRSIGTLAIIIAPTRELAKQISDVVEQLLQLRLRGRGTDDSAQDGVPDASERRTRWLVSGLLSGGATRTHEKARLRKGCPILVATPGRLLDHLQNTSSFNVSKCRWLVLDEADRLMELGFEETITGILKALDGRRKLAMQAVEDGVGTEVGGWDWERQRRSILCSATIREDVQKLAGVALNNPVVIKATEQEPTTANNTLTKSGTGSTNQPGSDLAMTTKFTPPTQLMQKYVVVPLKLRLVTLVSLLRALLSKTENKRGAKVIVFFSCTDSVDFHFRLLGSSSMSNDGSSAEKATDKKEEDSEEDSDEEEQEQQKQDKLEAAVRATSDLLPDVSIFRLHGSLALSQRLEAVKGFASTGSSGKQSLSATASSSSAPSILLCTSVASRGLDLPFVRAVVQYDLPTEGGATEYVHRVGRTARAGKGGEAWSFVGPSESEWVKWVEGRMMGEVPGVPAPVQGSEGTVQLRQEGLDDVLKGGLGGRGAEFEERATEVQLTFERWALKSKSHTELARKAYLSHIRAYATHPSDEKHIFHVKHLHLGHLAKAFALREAPSAVTRKTVGMNAAPKGRSRDARPGQRPKPSSVAKDSGTGAGSRTNPVASPGKPKKEGKKERDWQETYDPKTEARMNKAVRDQGKLTKRKGKLVSSGTGEFQIASGYDLEKMASR